MNLLLDTHTLLWFIAGSTRISSEAKRLVESAEHRKFVSTASIWEIAIKVSIGKMSLAEPFNYLFPRQLQINGFELLPIAIEHSSLVTTLPFHHRDPFDRMLVAQSLVEEMPIVSIDAAFDRYSVDRRWD